MTKNGMTKKADDRIILTLYTAIDQLDLVKKSIMEQFSEVSIGINDASDDGNGKESFKIPLQDNTFVQFSINSNDHYIKEQIPGMCNFFSQAPCENEVLKGHVLNQIRIFNCVIGCLFEKTNDEKRTNYIVNTLFAVAGDINGLVLFPNMTIFTHEGKLLFSIEGKSDFAQYTPIGNTDLANSKPKESTHDIARRERSFDLLKQKQISYLSDLRTSVTEYEAHIRTIDEMAQRLFALFAACVYSEALGSGLSREEALYYVERVDKILEGRLNDYLTKQERIYIDSHNPDSSKVISFGWRYEGCAVLLWALGFFPNLEFPDTICDVPAIAKILWNQNNLTSFIQKAKPRAKSSLLDAADLILRYHWACTDARVKKQEMPAHLNPGVVYERHYTLNWLIGANDHADWDNISPNT